MSIANPYKKRPGLWIRRQFLTIRNQPAKYIIAHPSIMQAGAPADESGEAESEEESDLRILVLICHSWICSHTHASKQTQSENGASFQTLAANPIKGDCGSVLICITLMLDFDGFCAVG